MRVLITTTIEVLDNQDETILIEDVESSVNELDKHVVFNEMQIHHARLKELWRRIKSIL